MASVHISKIIFRKIAELQESTELEIYRHFLNHITDFRLDVGILTNDMITELYGKEDKNPKYFDHRNHYNWSGLAGGVMDNNESLCFYQEKKGVLVKIFDDSILKKLFHSSKKSELFKKHIFLITKEQKQIEISYQCLLNSHISPYKSEINFVDGGIVKSIHLGYVLNEVIKQKYDSPTKLPNEISFDELTNSTTSFNYVNAPVIIVSHSGSKIDWRHSNKNNEKVQNYFSILSSYNEQNQNNPIIVCLSLDNDNNTLVGYTPSSIMKNQILKHFNQSKGRNPDVKDFLKQAAIKPQGKKSTKAQLKYDQKLEEIDEWITDHSSRCNCTCCNISKTYSKNVAKEGPQKLVKIDLDTKEYLKFFNLFNDTNLEKLNQVHKLSIASLDIESYTREMSRRSRVKQKIANISTIGRQAEVEGVQEIALIGYGDHFNSGNMNHYKLFSVTEEDDAKNVVSKLMDYIIIRQEIVKKEKGTLLAPFFTFINKYKDAHVSFWNEELKTKYSQDKLQEVIEESFQNSLIGKFEKHLQNLQSRFAIYTFNGGKYDLVLLHRHIASYFKEKGQAKPLNLIKKDSRIQKISLRTGIAFLDICDLIGPGNSLAKFSKLTGQEEVKMVFPFQCFKNINYLKETSLPVSKEEWFNDLKNEYTPDLDIKRAHQDFQRLGVKTVGEYLESYLESMFINPIFLFALY